MTAKKYHNYYSYKLSENSRVCGFFNVYQARNGSIQMMMGKSNVALPLEVINGLNINVVELQDFDMDAYEIYYKLVVYRAENEERLDATGDDYADTFFR